VVAVFFTTKGVPAELAVLDKDGTPVRGSVPAYASPERAAAALARVSRYAAWRAEPAGDFTPPPGIESDAARELVARLQSGSDDAEAADEEPSVDGRVLDDEAATALLACYGITLVESRRVAGADATVATAEEFGYPVAIKAVALGRAHTCALTTDGGVRCWGDNSIWQSFPPAGDRPSFSCISCISWFQRGRRAPPTRPPSAPPRRPGVPPRRGWPPSGRRRPCGPGGPGC